MRKLISYLLALCMLLSLASCAAGGKAAGEQTDNSSTPSAAATNTAYTGSAGFDVSKYAGTSVEIMWQETDSTQIDIVENYAKAAVEKAFGDYVKISWVGNVDTDIKTLAQIGELSDIWFSSGLDLELINSGVVLELTKYLEADTYLSDNFSNPNFFYFKDKIWTLSTGVDNFYTGTLYYNQDIFNKLGITSIATYDELWNACGLLKDAGYTPLTLDAGGGGGVFGRFMFQDLVISVDPLACESILKNEEGLNCSAVTKAMTLIANMRDAGFLGTGTGVKTGSESVSSFVEGKAAILYTNSWDNDSISKAAFPVTVAWWPSANDKYPTGEYRANLGSALAGWCARGDTKNPELLCEIIKVIVKAESERHLNAGLQTNFKQNGTPKPANDLEAQRLALYNKVGTWYKGFLQNTMDAPTQTTYLEQCSTLLSDDGYSVTNFVTALQAAWEKNTFFD